MVLPSSQASGADPPGGVHRWMKIQSPHRGVLQLKSPAADRVAVVADLSDGRIDDAVTAHLGRLTVHRAAVFIDRVAVVAGFVEVLDPVTADLDGPAVMRTAVAIQRVVVIADFTCRGVQ